DEETALLVLLIGPNRVMGARMHAPMRTPSTIATAPCRTDKPSMIGKAPRTAVASELAPPAWTRTKPQRLELRCSSGMQSIPWVSKDRVVLAPSGSCTLC